MKAKQKVHFIDCGGNIGQATKWVLERYDVDKIDIFEPLDFNYEILKKNFRDSRINLHKKAVWIKDEMVNFYIQDYGNRVGSTIIKGKWNTCQIPVQIEAIDLSNWIHQFIDESRYNILKLDIEGAEYDLLPYLFANSVDKKIDEWFIEFHGTKTPNYNKKVEQDFYSRQLKFREWGFCEQS